MTNAVDTIEKLREKCLTVSTAESCTGGLIAKLFTDIAGSSDVFEGGVVSYSNHVKEKILGVPHETLEQYGAVSEPVAKAMCEGARRNTDSSVAVSTTGIAGPGGGTPEKPVGTVCFGITSARGTRTYTKHFGSTLSREEIRNLSAEFALSLVREECERQ